MVQLELPYFFALIELAIVLLAVTAFLGWKLRRQRHGTPETPAESPDSAETPPAPALYLDREAARTRSFLDDIRLRPDEEPTAPALRGTLLLRSALLKEESLLAGRPTIGWGATDWKALAQQLAATLAAGGFKHTGQSAQIHGEDTVPTAATLAQQSQTIEHLREHLQRLQEKRGEEQTPDTQLLEQLDKLAHNNRELTQCIAVLEDENTFLRDQIAALLKV
ncbi:MAG: hypothetical protein ABR553_03990 [Gammaproteobacteria bacterium]